jgi:hypothetical protein
MNAAYGKLCQKPIDENLVFKNNEESHKKFLSYNHNHIKSYVKLSDGKYCYKVQKPINEHFNMAHLGVQVLSMSKRIMNEVMCLAEDLNIKIYYQDTDSMHIDKSKVSLLAEEFNKLYNKELIGESLGQFHGDFDVRNSTTGKKIKNCYAKESYFLGKKSYLDVLTVDSDEEKFMDTNYHIRLKGISKNAFPDDIINCYDSLFKGNSYSFDLLKNKAKFHRNKDFTYSMEKSFIRTVKF